MKIIYHGKDLFMLFPKQFTDWKYSSLKYFFYILEKPKFRKNLTKHLTDHMIFSFCIQKTTFVKTNIWTLYIIGKAFSSSFQNYLQISNILIISFFYNFCKTEIFRQFDHSPVKSHDFFVIPLKKKFIL